MYTEERNHIYPKIFKIDKGQNLSVDCESYEPVKWFHKDLKSSPISTSPVLTIKEIDFTEGGVYYCYSSYVKKKKTHYFIDSTEVLVFGNTN